MKTAGRVLIFLAALGAVFGAAWGVGSAGATEEPPATPMNHETMR